MWGGGVIVETPFETLAETFVKTPCEVKSSALVETLVETPFKDEPPALQDSNPALKFCHREFTRLILAPLKKFIPL